MTSYFSQFCGLSEQVLSWVSHWGSLMWLVRGWLEQKAQDGFLYTCGHWCWLLAEMSQISSPWPCILQEFRPSSLHVVFKAALRERESQKRQALLRPRLQNVPIIFTTFCWSDQFARPAQIQEGRDRDSTSGLKMLQKHISKVSAYWDGKNLWPLNSVSQGAMCLLLLCTKHPVGCLVHKRHNKYLLNI